MLKIFIQNRLNVIIHNQQNINCTCTVRAHISICFQIEKGARVCEWESERDAAIQRRMKRIYNYYYCYLFTIYIKFRKTSNFQCNYASASVRRRRHSRNRILMPIASNRLGQNLFAYSNLVFCNLFIIDVSFICLFFGLAAPNSVRKLTVAASPLFIAIDKFKNDNFHQFMPFFSLVQFTLFKMPFAQRPTQYLHRIRNWRFNERRRSVHLFPSSFA